MHSQLSINQNDSMRKNMNDNEDDYGDNINNQSNYDLSRFTQKENENIENFEKKFGKLYKTFDVGFVKKRIWDTIKTIKSNTNKLTFDNLINNISDNLDKKIIENISTSTCFVCLLHLANEKSIYT